MKIILKRSKNSDIIINSAVVLLQGAFDGIDRDSLIGALTSYSNNAKQKKEELLTINQTAERIGVTTMTIQRYLKAGLLPKIKIGSRLVRIPKSAVDEMLNIEEKNDFKVDIDSIIKDN